MIDWNRVRALRDEVGADDFEEVVEIFLEEVDGEIDRLSANAPINLGERLHFLKGSALNLGFRKFSDLCRDGEQQSSSGSAEPVDLAGLVDCYRNSRTFFLTEVATRMQDQTSL